MSKCDRLANETIQFQALLVSWDHGNIFRETVPRRSASWWPKTHVFPIYHTYWQPTFMA